MEQIFSGYTGTHVLALAIGVALLVAGRKLYWLALGGVGFFAGLWLADRYLDIRAAGLELGLAFLVAILGAWAVSAAQRLAIALGGFFLGGAIAYWIGAWLTVPLDWNAGPWLWAVGFLGAVFGTFFAAVLFDASLIALTSFLGAILLSQASRLGPPHEGWLFLVLLLVGMVAQSGSGEREKQPARA